MDTRDDDITRHAAELVRLTRAAFDHQAREHVLPEDELATLGMLIATERQLLIDAVGALLQADEGEAAAPGVAEFDAGFRYGLEFARAIDDTRVAFERVRRGQLLRLVRGSDRG